MSSFKDAHSLEKRRELSQKILNTYPDRVPVIIEPATGSNNPLTIKKKKTSSLLLNYTDENQSALTRLIEVFKANAQALGIDVKITENQKY